MIGHENNAVEFSFSEFAAILRSSQNLPMSVWTLKRTSVTSTHNVERMREGKQTYVRT